MSNNGDLFKYALVKEIESWNKDIEVKIEKIVGCRFVDSPRKLDIVLRNKKNNKFLAIEAKFQKESGTAYQKLIYTIEDCKSCPIPTIIVFCGDGIKQDLKSRLIQSGIGLEVKYEDGVIKDKYKLFKQRVYIELGLNWFEIYE